jgi:hypothetical protein
LPRPMGRTLSLLLVAVVIGSLLFGVLLAIFQP